jgi:hypothetical protein
VFVYKSHVKRLHLERLATVGLQRKAFICRVCMQLLDSTYLKLGNIIHPLQSLTMQMHRSARYSSSCENTCVETRKLNHIRR